MTTNSKNRQGKKCEFVALTAVFVWSLNLELKVMNHARCVLLRRLLGWFFSSQKLCRFLWLYDWGAFGPFNDSGSVRAAHVFEWTRKFVTLTEECMRNVRRSCLKPIEIRYKFCGSLSSHADHSIKATLRVRAVVFGSDAIDLSFFNGSARFRHPWTII